MMQSHPWTGEAPLSPVSPHRLSALPAASGAPAGMPAGLADQAIDSLVGPNPFIGVRPQDMVESVDALLVHALFHPIELVGRQIGMIGDLVGILFGRNDRAPAPTDRRFDDPAWQGNPFYRMLLQTYLTVTRAMLDYVDGTSLDPVTRQRARYAVTWLTDAVAPTNTVLGNPAVFRRTWESRGANLIAGFQNFADDAVRNGLMPAQVDKRAFDVGRNLALSPGAVVFRNPVLELIQYRPRTATVHARPHVIVPPELNKFYMFDLAPGRSLVEYLVGNGLQTFVISWRNPSPAERDWGLDTYVAAIREAIEVACEITGSPDILLHAACSGAITAAALAGHLAAKDDPVIRAMTMMVAVLGRSEGTLGHYTTPETIAATKALSAERGVLGGIQMQRLFAWLRPNELVWSYWINNYLMGDPPPAHDLLYWSNDVCRLPARFHGEIIDIMTDDRLMTPGGLSVLGTPVDLGQVRADTFFIAGATDHITPWREVYAAARRFGSQARFVLSSAGHIGSLINPPGAAKGRFLHGPAAAPDPEAWLAQADPVEGSWWDHWRDWAVARSGALVPAPDRVGSPRHPAGDPAPGRYVLDA